MVLHNTLGFVSNNEARGTQITLSGDYNHFKAALLKHIDANKNIGKITLDVLKYHINKIFVKNVNYSMYLHDC